MINEELNQLEIYKRKSCIYCHRQYPQTILNIEGVIHHKEKFRCIDMRSCNRISRRIAKKASLDYVLETARLSGERLKLKSPLIEYLKRH